MAWLVSDSSAPKQGMGSVGSEGSEQWVVALGFLRGKEPGPWEGCHRGYTQQGGKSGSVSKRCDLNPDLSNFSDSSWVKTAGLEKTLSSSEASPPTRDLWHVWYSACLLGRTTPSQSHTQPGSGSPECPSRARTFAQPGLLLTKLPPRTHLLSICLPSGPRWTPTCQQQGQPRRGVGGRWLEARREGGGESWR